MGNGENLSMKTRIWVGLITLYLVWGGTYLAIRFAIETMPPFLMAGSRFFLAGLLFYSISRLRGATRPTSSEWKAAAIIGLLLITVANGCLTLAEKRVASGVASLVIATVPFWMILIDAILVGSFRLSLLELAGLLTGFVGIVFLIGPALVDLKSESLNLTGLALLLSSAISIAVGAIYNREAGLPESNQLAAGMELLGGASAMLLIGLLLGEVGELNLAAVSSRSWTAYIYLLLFGSITGYGTFIWLLRVAPTPLVSTYAYVNPLVALLLGTMIGREPLNARIIISAAAIIGSIFLINLGRARASKASLEITAPLPAED
jgi:drug/metabolite transporter (DMT)-like permease